MHPRAFIRTPLDLAMPRDATALLLVSMLALIGYLATLGGLALVLLGDDLRAWNRSLMIPSRCRFRQRLRRRASR